MNEPRPVFRIGRLADGHITLSQLTDESIPSLFRAAVEGPAWPRVNAAGRPNSSTFNDLLWRHVYGHFQVNDAQNNLIGLLAVWKTDLIHRTAWLDVLVLTDVPAQTMVTALTLMLEHVFVNSPFRKLDYEHFGFQPNELDWLSGEPFATSGDRKWWPVVAACGKRSPRPPPLHARHGFRSFAPSDRTVDASHNNGVQLGIVRP